MYQFCRIGVVDATWCWVQSAYCQHPSTVQMMVGSPPTSETLVAWENFAQTHAKFRWAAQHVRERFPPMWMYDPMDEDAWNRHA